MTRNEPPGDQKKITPRGMAAEKDLKEGGPEGDDKGENDHLRNPRYLTRWEEMNRLRGVRPVLDPERGPENK